MGLPIEYARLLRSAHAKESAELSIATCRAKVTFPCYLRSDRTASPFMHESRLWLEASLAQDLERRPGGGRMLKSQTLDDLRRSCVVAWCHAGRGAG
jgi:hypothetical protein